MKIDPQKLAQGLRAASDILLNKDKMNPNIILDAFFSARFSSPEAYFDSWASLYQMNQPDYPELQNREQVNFPSGSHSLTGYLYKKELAKGLLLYVHGMRDLADGGYESPGIVEWLKRGYAVFAIDLSNSGRSDRYCLNGLQQSALDVAAAETYIHKRIDLSGLPLYLFGHSWGAYGVAASLALDPSPIGVACISGFAFPVEAMVQVPVRYAGQVVEVTRESLEQMMSKRDPSYWNLSASNAVRNAQRCHVFVAHGGKDAVVSPTSCLYSELKQDTPSNVKLSFYPDKEHTGILFSDESWNYRKALKERSQELAKTYGKSVANAPLSAVEDFKSTFSKPMSSIVNKELYEQMDDFFSQSLSRDFVR